MRQFFIIGLAIAGFSGTLPGEAVSGDAARGEQLLRDRGCVVCHKVDGKGGDAGPNLGRRMSRSYTLGYVVSAIWNHPLSRWAKLDTGAAGKPILTEDQAADLLAYFASNRYFERLGDARRGKHDFAAEDCAGCHDLGKPLAGGGNPVVAWGELTDPIAFAQVMWNRPPAMLGAFAKKEVDYPELTSQEVTDLQVYLENLPQVRNQKARFCLGSAEQGMALIQAKGCLQCHQGKLSLDAPAPRRTVADITAGMWNHPEIGTGQRPPLSYQEISDIVVYLWFVQDHGDARRGSRLFAKKKCTSCHPDGSTPSISSRPDAAPLSMLAAVLNHEPTMSAAASRGGMHWPHLSGAEMEDLWACVASRRSLGPR